MNIPICPRCGSVASTTEGQFGPLHQCCGLMSWKYKPLVRVQVLHARRKAHESFDRIWKDGYMTRTQAYKWLARRLRMTEEDCHISKMGERTAKRVVAVSDQFIRWKTCEGTGTPPAE